MRYAICFTPAASEPLSHVAANWLGRNVFSGEMVEPTAIRGLSIHEIAFHTAMPRRYGFHGVLKAPFRLAADVSEAQLLRDLMRFCGTLSPFQINRLEVARLGALLQPRSVAALRTRSLSCLRRRPGVRSIPRAVERSGNRAHGSRWSVGRAVRQSASLGKPPCDGRISLSHAADRPRQPTRHATGRTGAAERFRAGPCRSASRSRTSR